MTEPAFNAASEASRIPLDELYQEVILDHNRNPRNFRPLGNDAQHCHAYNPLCGDDYDVFVSADRSGRIQDIGFTGKGCAISKASGSMMTAKIKGKTFDEARQIRETFLKMVTQSAAPQESERALLGSLHLFRGVQKYPIRVKCATLVWHALEEVFKKIQASNSTGGAL